VFAIFPTLPLFWRAYRPDTVAAVADLGGHVSKQPMGSWSRYNRPLICVSKDGISAYLFSMYHLHRTVTPLYHQKVCDDRALLLGLQVTNPRQ